MIQTLIHEPEPRSLMSLQQYISRYCPYLKVEGASACPESFNRLMADVKPELVFIADEARDDTYNGKKQNGLRHRSCQVIYLAGSEKGQEPVDHSMPFRFISKPIEVMDFLVAVNDALTTIMELRKQNASDTLFKPLNGLHAAGEIIAIPTTEGFDFLSTADIIRCEGMQKCTKVFMENGATIVSSYSLGQFAKMLEPFHFISPHRSHLINARKMTHYHREGTITMQDGSHVPLAIRRKETFLQAIRRVG